MASPPSGASTRHMAFSSSLPNSNDCVLTAPLPCYAFASRRFYFTESLRDYQRALVELAKQRNVIVQLETGQGKTLIAIHVLLYFAERLRREIVLRNFLATSGYDSLVPRRWMVFVVPKVVLCQQQAKYIATQTDLRVGELYGDLGTDYWSEGTWKDWLDNHDIICSTAGSFCNMLRASIMHITQVDLLVLDECHHATGQSDYSVIMEYYRGAKVELARKNIASVMNGDSVLPTLQNSSFLAEQILEIEAAASQRLPRIVGLTASASNASIKDFAEWSKWQDKAWKKIFMLEERLDACLVTVPDLASRSINMAPFLYSASVCMRESPSAFVTISQSSPHEGEYSLSQIETLMLKHEQYLYNCASANGILSSENLNHIQESCLQEPKGGENIVLEESAPIKQSKEVLVAYQEGKIYPSRGYMPCLQAVILASAASEVEATSLDGFSDEAGLFHHILPAEATTLSQILADTMNVFAEHRNGTFTNASREEIRGKVEIDQVATELSGDSVQMNPSRRSNILSLLEKDVESLLESVGVPSIRKWKSAQVHYTNADADPFLILASRLSTIRDNNSHIDKKNVHPSRDQYSCEAEDDECQEDSVSLSAEDESFELSEKVLMLARILNLHAKLLLLHGLALQNRIYFRGNSQTFRFTSEEKFREAWTKWITLCLESSEGFPEMAPNEDQQSRNSSSRAQEDSEKASFIIKKFRQAFPSSSIIFSEERRTCHKLYSLYEKSPLFAPSRAFRKAAYILGHSMASKASFIWNSSVEFFFEQKEKLVLASDKVFESLISVAYGIDKFGVIPEVNHMSNSNSETKCEDQIRTNPVKGMSSNMQRKFANQFASGQKQLLFATAVADEGLDVSNCDVVIMFDGAKDVQTYIQRRGRARSRSNIIFLFSDKSNTSIAENGQYEPEILKRLRLQYMVLKELSRSLSERNLVTFQGKTSSFNAADFQISVEDMCAVEKDLDFKNDITVESLDQIVSTLQIPIECSQQCDIASEEFFWIGQGPESVELDFQEISKSEFEDVQYSIFSRCLHDTKGDEEGINLLVLIANSLSTSIDAFTEDSCFFPCTQALLTNYATAPTNHGLSILADPIITVLQENLLNLLSFSKLVVNANEGYRIIDYFMNELRRRADVPPSRLQYLIDRFLAMRFSKQRSAGFSLGKHELYSLNTEELKMLMAGIKIPTLNQMMLGVVDTLNHFIEENELEQGTPKIIYLKSDDKQELNEQLNKIKRRASLLILKAKVALGRIRYACLVEFLSLQRDLVVKNAKPTSKLFVHSMITPISNETDKLEPDATEAPLLCWIAVSTLWQVCNSLNQIKRKAWLSTIAEGRSSFALEDSFAKILVQQDVVSPVFSFEASVHGCVCKLQLSGLSEFTYFTTHPPPTFESYPTKQKESKEVVSLICLAYLRDVGILDSKWKVDKQRINEVANVSAIESSLQEQASTTICENQIREIYQSILDRNGIVQKDKYVVPKLLLSGGEFVHGQASIVRFDYPFEKLKFVRIFSNSDQPIDQFSVSTSSAEAPALEQMSKESNPTAVAEINEQTHESKVSSVQIPRYLSLTLDEIDSILELDESGFSSFYAILVASVGESEMQMPYSIRRLIEQLMCSKSERIYFKKEGEEDKVDEIENESNSVTVWSWLKRNRDICSSNDVNGMTLNDILKVSKALFFAAKSVWLFLHEGQIEQCCCVWKTILQQHPDLAEVMNILNLAHKCTHSLRIQNPTVETAITKEVLNQEENLVSWALPSIKQIRWHLYYLYLYAPKESHGKDALSLLPISLMLPRKLPESIEELPFAVPDILDFKKEQSRVYTSVYIVHACDLIRDIRQQMILKNETIPQTDEPKREDMPISYLNKLLDCIQASEIMTKEKFEDATEVSARYASVACFSRNGMKDHECESMQRNTQRDIATLLSSHAHAQSHAMRRKHFYPDPNRFSSLFQKSDFEAANASQESNSSQANVLFYPQLLAHVASFINDMKCKEVDLTPLLSELSQTSSHNADESESLDHIECEPRVKSYLFTPIRPFRISSEHPEFSGCGKAFFVPNLRDAKCLGKSLGVTVPRFTPSCVLSDKYLYLDVSRRSRLVARGKQGDCLHSSSNSSGDINLSNEFSMWGLGVPDWTHMKRLRSMKLVSNTPIGAMLNSAQPNSHSEITLSKYDREESGEDAITNNSGHCMFSEKLFGVSGGYNHVGEVLFCDKQMAKIRKKSFSIYIDCDADERVLLTDLSSNPHQNRYVPVFHNGEFKLVDASTLVPLESMGELDLEKLRLFQACERMKGMSSGSLEVFISQSFPKYLSPLSISPLTRKEVFKCFGSSHHRSEIINEGSVECKDSLLQNMSVRSMVLDQIPLPLNIGQKQMFGECVVGVTRASPPTYDFFRRALKDTYAEFSSISFDYFDKNEFYHERCLPTEDFDFEHPSKKLQNLISMHACLNVNLSALELIIAALILPTFSVDLEWKSNAYEVAATSLGLVPTSMSTNVFDPVFSSGSNCVVFSLLLEAMNPYAGLRRKTRANLEESRFEVLESIGDAFHKLCLISTMSLITKSPRNMRDCVPLSVVTLTKDYLSSNSNISQCIIQAPTLTKALRVSDLEWEMSFSLSSVDFSVTPEASLETDPKYDGSSLSLWLPSCLDLSDQFPKSNFESCFGDSSERFSYLLKLNDFVYRNNKIGEIINGNRLHGERTFSCVGEALIGAVLLSLNSVSFHRNSVDSFDKKQIYNLYSSLKLLPQWLLPSLKAFLANMSCSKELKGSWMGLLPTAPMIRDPMRVVCVMDEEKQDNVAARVAARVEVEVVKLIYVAVRSSSVEVTSDMFQNSSRSHGLQLMEKIKDQSARILSETFLQMPSFSTLAHLPNIDISWLVREVLKDWSLVRNFVMGDWYLSDCISNLLKELREVFACDSECQKDELEFSVLLRPWHFKSEQLKSPAQLALSEGPLLSTLVYCRSFSHLLEIQEAIGYTFKVPSLLVTAFIHPSKSDSHPSNADEAEKQILYHNSRDSFSFGSGYNRLELIGDAVLDWLICATVFSNLFTEKRPRHGSNSHSQESILSKLRSQFCSTQNLALACALKGWYKFLEQNDVFTASAKLFCEECASYSNDDGVAAFRSSTLLTSGIRGPKFLADIIEAIIGAVYVDSMGDMNECWLVSHKLLGPISKAIYSKVAELSLESK